MIELETIGDVRVLHLRAGENRFNRTTIDSIHQALDEVTDSPADHATTSSTRSASKDISTPAGRLGSTD